MTTRTAPYNASLARELIRYRIEVKQSGKWKPLRIRGQMPTFDSPYKANDYGIFINSQHKSLTPCHPAKKI